MKLDIVFKFSRKNCGRLLKNKIQACVINMKKGRPVIVFLAILIHIGPIPVRNQAGE